MAIPRDPHKMVITLEGIQPAQAIALKKMFKYMEFLGKIGSSRMCSFYADGDGNFRPKVTIDYPIELPDVPEIHGVITRDEIKTYEQPRAHEGDFVIDFDEIAWKIYHD